MTLSAPNLGEEWLPPPGEHPPKADLIAYREDRLAEAEGEKIRAHITTCILCRGLFLNLGRVSAASSRKPPPARRGTRRLHGRSNGQPVPPQMTSKASMKWKKPKVEKHMYDSVTGMLDPLG